MSELEPTTWATWNLEWHNACRVRKLVVVEATTEQEARRESGLPFAAFHRATEEELLAWELVTDRPLTEGDADALIGLVARALRGLHNKQVNKRAKGEEVDPRDVQKARLFNQLRGRLELIEAEPDAYLGHDDPTGVGVQT
jgi:hypothetical protein